MDPVHLSFALALMVLMGRLWSRLRGIGGVFEGMEMDGIQEMVRGRQGRKGTSLSLFTIGWSGFDEVMEEGWWVWWRLATCWAKINGETRTGADLSPSRSHLRSQEQQKVFCELL